MTAHLTLPYNWVDCSNPETCEEYVHLKEAATELNNYPREWVRQLLPLACVIHEGIIKLYNNDDEIHSQHGAAVEYTDGKIEWRQHNKFHREDGPAVIWPDGTQEWYSHGEIHRTGGPAVEKTNGHKEWWRNGTRHREDGPAIIMPDGRMEWWYDDILQTVYLK